MKNEYKIDHVSMHGDRDLDLQNFGKKIGALERGLRPLERGLCSRGKNEFFRYFSWKIFGTTRVL